MVKSHYYGFTAWIYRSLLICDVTLLLVWHVDTVSAISVLVSNVFGVHELTGCYCFMFFFVIVSCCRGLLQGKCAKDIVFHHMQQAGTFGGFLRHDEILLHNLWSFQYHSARDFSSSWSMRKLENWALAPKYELLQSNSCLIGCERVVETRAEFYFCWVYTFSAMFSSLRNWANHDRYRLRPSTPARLCWSSSRPQPLQQIWPYWITTVSAMNLKSL